MAEATFPTRPGGPSGDDVLVVRESRSVRNAVFGVFSVALVGFYALVATSSHLSVVVKVVLAAVFVALIVSAVGVWRWSSRHPDHIEVSTDRIRYVAQGKNDDHPDLVRADGGDLRFALRLQGAGQIKSNVLYLEQPATSRSWELQFFDKKAVAAACQGRGWNIVP